MIRDNSIIALAASDDRPIGPGFIQVLPDGSEAQCEQANVADGWRGSQRESFYKAQGLDPKRCARSARYELGTRLLCAQHAGGLLLDLALTMSLQRDSGMQRSARA